MNTTTEIYREAIQDAERNVAAAHERLTATRRAANVLCPVSIGERIPGKTAAGGNECEFEVTDIFASVGREHLTFRVSGKKVKKDGSLANIECYVYVNVK